MENNFEKLYQTTKEHIDSKKYLYRAVKKKNGKVLTRNGKEELNPPTTHKIVLLSLAFNIALENYQNIRYPKTAVKEIKSINEVSDLLLRYFSNKFYNTIDTIKTNSSLIDTEQNYQYEEIEKFRKIEYKLYGTIVRFRNYHSHHIHEPSILTFEDYFENDKLLSKEDFTAAKKWFLKRFLDAKTHLIQSLTNRKEKLEKEGAQNVKACEEIESVLKSFKKIHFFKKDKKTISLDGRLFIACMFLYKRQAKIILDKWRNVKRAEGYENSKYTFFTYYCLSESYSLNNYNDNLLKFRNITSKLSTIPYNSNRNLEFIYKRIREVNEENYTKIENEERKKTSKQRKIQKKISYLKRNIRYKKINKNEAEPKLEELKNEVDNIEDKAKIIIDKLKKQLMPIRKRHILTSVLLQYIIDNNLIKDKKVKIAVKKTPNDILSYYEKHKDVLDKTKNLTYLKNQIKKLDKNVEQRKTLNEHLKELKRNFTFKTIADLQDQAKPQAILDKDKNIIGYKPPIGYNFTLKKKNVLLQVDFNGFKTNVTLSPELLLKWVFVHLVNGNNCFTSIKKFIIGQHKRFNNATDSKKLLADFYKNPKNNHLKGSIFPKSIRKNIADNEIISLDSITTTIENNIKNLENFQKTNSLQPKPWKFESKRKIDTILEYIHFKLLEDVYLHNIWKGKDNTAEDYIRHTYFNMTTYNIAREYFRFFGRYKSNNITSEKQHSLAIINALKEKHTKCFSYIEAQIKYANSLEEVFNAVINIYIDDLKSLQQKVTQNNTNSFIKILKINTTSYTTSVNKLLKENFYAKSFSLPPKLISIEKECPNLWQEFKTEKEKTLNGKEFRCSDFSFLRNYLQQDNIQTNIDFIFKHIIPKTNTVKIPNNTFKQLLKLKTEELILWAVAKQYWLTANNSAYTYNKTEKNSTSSSYQEFCTFNKVYNKVIDYTLTIPPNFWTTNKGTPNKEQVRFARLLEADPEITQRTLKFSIKVPAKRYDNKFLGVETKLIKEFCLWNFYDPKTGKIKLPKKYTLKKSNNTTTQCNLQEYEDLMYVIYSKLKTSIEDIKFVLTVEKSIVDTNKDKMLTILEKKYKNQDKIEDFYIALTNSREDKFSNDIVLWKKFIEKAKESENSNMTIIESYLHLYRNFALHYQLQDPEYKKEIIQFLKQISQKIETKCNNYTTKEE